MKPPQFRLAQPPARPLVKTGPDAARLFTTAQQLESKGRPVYCRITAPIKGERFALAVYQARHKATGETWTLAAYHSRTIPGHVRRVLIDPEGRNWTLFPATDQDHPRALHQHDKYRAHLWQLLTERNQPR